MKLEIKGYIHITCPNCKFEHEELHTERGEIDEMDCYSCGERFIYITKEITYYKTFKLSDKRLEEELI